MMKILIVVALWTLAGALAGYLFGRFARAGRNSRR